MRSRDIVVGEVYAIGRADDPAGAVPAHIEDDLGAGAWNRWHIRFTEEVILGYGYRPAKEDDPYWYGRIDEDYVSSRWVLATWEQHLINDIEREREGEVEKRRHRIAEAAADQMFVDITELLINLGVDTLDEELVIQVDRVACSVHLAMPAPVAARLLFLPNERDIIKLVAQANTLIRDFGFVPGDLLRAQQNLWSRQAKLNLSLPVDSGETFLYRLRARHFGDSNEGALVEELLS